MKKEIKQFLISRNLSIKDAMRQMSKAAERILFVVDDKGRLLGSLTDGDIRRWFLKEGDLGVAVEGAYNKSPVCVEKDYSLEDVKRIMLKEKIEWIPVVNGKKRIHEILFWENVFGKETGIPREKIDLPVVIMAGGKGTRLDPFTKILPKPLVPVGEKAIIEIIMDKFHQYGIEEFYLSVNHKSHMIKAYFEEINGPYKIKYIEEEKPLGTAGSLRFLHGRIGKNLLVSNCDIIIEGDYTEVVKFHKAKNNDITIVGSFRHLTIPYGICTIENGGDLVKIDEKPEYDFLANTGMYLIKSDVLAYIPEGQFFGITDLVKSVQAHKGKVGVFPIDEKSWIDIGQWEEYRRTLRALELYPTQ